MGKFLFVLLAVGLVFVIIRRNSQKDIKEPVEDNREEKKEIADGPIFDGDFNQYLDPVEEKEITPSEKYRSTLADIYFDDDWYPEQDD